MNFYWPQNVSNPYPKCNPNIQTLKNIFSDVSELEKMEMTD